MASKETQLDDNARGDLEELTASQIAQRESENGARQFDRMLDFIRLAIRPDLPFRLRPSMVTTLNALAIEGLEQSPGAYRSSSIVIQESKHVPPPWTGIPALMDDMCEYVNENWETASAIHLSAYCMWRINWIHPFMNGNGRTSRAVSYVVLCAHLKALLPGRPTIPEIIATDTKPYYRALEHADGILLRKKLIDVSRMEALIESHLTRQLAAAVQKAAEPQDPAPAG